MLSPMSVTFVIVLGMLIAMAAGAMALCLAYPTGKMAALWQEVPAEERVRFGVTPTTSVQRVGQWFFSGWMGCYLLAQVLSIQEHGDWPGVAFFRSKAALWILVLCYPTQVGFHLRWSWYVRRLPEGVVSAPLRALARWTFALSAGAMGLLVLLIGAAWIVWA